MPILTNAIPFLDMINPKQTLEMVKTIYTVLLEKYSMMDIRRAFAASNQDPQKTIDYLTDGQWMTGKLVSFNWTKVDEGATFLSEELEIDHQVCYQTICNCAGSIELARLKLTTGVKFNRGENYG